jgi:hypothetical protein
MVSRPGASIFRVNICPNHSAKRELKVRSAKSLVFIVVAVGFLWLNLTVNRTEGKLKPPDELGPITRYLFYRGWPLSPWMACSFHGGKWHPDEGFIWITLALDAAILCVSLFVTWVSIERLIRWWQIAVKGKWGKSAGSRQGLLPGAPTDPDVGKPGQS